MKKRTSFVSCLQLFLFFAAASVTAQPADSIKVNVSELKPGLCIMDVYGLKSLVSFGPDGVLLIDPGQNKPRPT